MNFKDLYKVNEDGVIHQKNIKELQKYDIQYIKERYDKYGVSNDEMSFLRVGFMYGVIGENINKILDVGYGNGSFLNVCNLSINECYGNDISGYPLPENVNFVYDITDDEYDVVCFFDVLEHFEDIEFVKNLKTKYIYLSVPWCHNFSEEWFMNWKHRRYDEHIWHFNSDSLDKFMYRIGYELVSEHSNIEDVLRTPEYDYENILSCIYKKID